MPEMPEVETIANDLRNAGLAGLKIKDVEIATPSIVAEKNLPEFRKKLLGAAIISIKRRAKYLIFSLSNGANLVIHLRMTGRFTLVKSKVPKTKHDHVTLLLENGLELRYHDTRKFGRWYLTEKPDEMLEYIGPEPLEDSFTAQYLADSLKNRVRCIKALLLDQEVLAGLGNIYVDEALWEAKIHPERSGGSLTSNEIASLFEAIKIVLIRGLETHGTTLGQGKTNYYRLNGKRGEHQTRLNVFRRTGLPCPRCENLIQRIRICQRSSHFCPSCQRLEGSN